MQTQGISSQFGGDYRQIEVNTSVLSTNIYTNSFNDDSVFITPNGDELMIYLDEDENLVDYLRINTMLDTDLELIYSNIINNSQYILFKTEENICFNNQIYYPGWYVVKKTLQ